MPELRPEPPLQMLDRIAGVLTPTGRQQSAILPG
jgi:hypothetical protein